MSDPGVIHLITINSMRLCEEPDAQPVTVDISLTEDGGAAKCAQCEDALGRARWLGEPL